MEVAVEAVVVVEVLLLEEVVVVVVVWVVLEDSLLVACLSLNLLDKEELLAQEEP